MYLKSVKVELSNVKIMSEKDGMFFKRSEITEDNTIYQMNGKEIRISRAEKMKTTARRRSSIFKIRSTMYQSAKILGDIEAVSKGPKAMEKRMNWQILGERSCPFQITQTGRRGDGVVDDVVTAMSPTQTIVELIQLYSQLSFDDITGIFLFSLKKAVTATIISKVTSLGEFVNFVFDSLVKSTKYLYKIIMEEKWKFPKRMFNDFLSIVKERAAALEKMWKSMSGQEIKKTAFDFLIIISSTLIFGGGLDMEGGFPDLDIKAGIGNHRNLFSHTILLGLTLELGLRFMGNVLVALDERGIEPKSIFLRSVLDFAKNTNDKIIQGMWTGLFFHYLKDANVFSARTKPYVGVHGLSMGTHKTIFASNAILSAIFAISVEPDLLWSNTTFIKKYIPSYHAPLFMKLSNVL